MYPNKSEQPHTNWLTALPLTVTQSIGLQFSFICVLRRAKHASDRSSGTCAAEYGFASFMRKLCMYGKLFKRTTEDTVNNGLGTSMYGSG